MQHTNNRITHYETSTQTATQLNSQQTDKRQPLVGRLSNCLVATTRTTHIRRVYTLHKGPTDTENGRSRRYRADVAIRQRSICGGLYSGSGRAINCFRASANRNHSKPRKAAAAAAAAAATPDECHHECSFDSARFGCSLSTCCTHAARSTLSAPALLIVVVMVQVDLAVGSQWNTQGERARRKAWQSTQHLN